MSEQIGRIQSVIARYSHLLDDQDYDAFVALFVPEGVLHFGGVDHVGRETIAREVAAIQPARPGKHLTAVADIELVGDDRATARVDMVTFGYDPEGAIKLGGMSRYYDRLVLVDGEWLFESRRMRRPGEPAPVE
jgi:uncharacterized protein (TIGR02246 family)